jgi:hypothetical protein
LADTNLSAFIWSVADLLRGDYKQSDYGKVRAISTRIVTRIPASHSGAENRMK